MRALLILIILCSFFSCGEKADKARANHKNLYEVSLGMNENEVIKIMGKPIIKRGVLLRENEFYELHYDSEFGMSDNIKFFFSVKDSLVVDIYDGR